MSTRSNLIFVHRIAAVLLFFVAPNVDAAQLRSYEFVDGQERLFTFRGGLLGIDARAQLTGSFDIEIEEDGASRLTRFDVRLIDVLDQGMFNVGWSDGDSLAEQLFVNPVGLAGTQMGASITLGEPTFQPDSYTDPGGLFALELLQPNMPNTYIRLQDLNGGLATLRISSSPSALLDNPTFNTQLPGFTLRLIPEPASWILAAVALGGAGIRRRLPRPYFQDQWKASDRSRSAI